eukprot:964487-Amorphochlora_amoeboformis.AAC.2
MEYHLDLFVLEGADHGMESNWDTSSRVSSTCKVKPTSTNMRDGSGLIEEKLDLCFAKKNWITVNLTLQPVHKTRSPGLPGILTEMKKQQLANTPALATKFEKTPIKRLQSEKVPFQVCSPGWP